MKTGWLRSVCSSGGGGGGTKTTYRLSALACYALILPFQPVVGGSILIERVHCCRAHALNGRAPAARRVIYLRRCCILEIGGGGGQTRARRLHVVEAALLTSG